MTNKSLKTNMYFRVDKSHNVGDQDIHTVSITISRYVKSDIGEPVKYPRRQFCEMLADTQYTIEQLGIPGCIDVHWSQGKAYGRKSD